MNLSPRLSESLDALLHESASVCALTRARHVNFIGLSLLTPLCASIAAPLLLAFSGAPALWQAGAFGFAMLPLAGVALLSRRGVLEDAQAFSLASLAGLACVAAAAAGPGLGAGLFLLALAFEAALTCSSRMRWVSLGAGALAFVLLLASAVSLIPPAGAAPLADAAFGLCAFAYGLGLAWTLRHERDMGEAQQARECAEHAAMRVLANDAGLRLNRAGGVIAASGEGLQALGLRARDVLGRGFFERVHVADRPLFLKALSEAAGVAGISCLRLRLRGPDVGEPAEPTFRQIDLRLRHVAGEGDAFVAMALMRDVTELVGAETYIPPRPVFAATESADGDWKDRLLANVSHELRTPLNAIIGFSEMLSGGRGVSPTPAQSLEYAGIINASGRHLLSIVNALLDMSKMEAGRFELAAEPVDLAPLVESCCDIVRLKAESAEVEIFREIAPGVGPLVADERACRQIVLNLLSNAIKFTPKGGRVTLQARNDGEHLLLSVADTGIGVSPADLPRLGDPFFQAQAQGDVQDKGTGLGLSVVKGLVGLHGGAISVESAPGQGTCVTIRLPRGGCAVEVVAPRSATIEIIPRRAAAPVQNATKVKKIA